MITTDSLLRVLKKILVSKKKKESYLLLLVLDHLEEVVVCLEKMELKVGWVIYQRQSQRLPITFPLRSLVYSTKDGLLLVLIYHITVSETFVHLLCKYNYTYLSLKKKKIINLKIKNY